VCGTRSPVFPLLFPWCPQFLACAEVPDRSFGLETLFPYIIVPSHNLHNENPRFVWDWTRLVMGWTYGGGRGASVIFRVFEPPAAFMAFSIVWFYSGRFSLINIYTSVKLIFCIVLWLSYDHDTHLALIFSRALRFPPFYLARKPYFHILSCLRIICITKIRGLYGIWPGWWRIYYRPMFIASRAFWGSHQLWWRSRLSGFIWSVLLW